MSKLKLIVLIFAVYSGELLAQNYNRPSPLDEFKYEFQKYDGLIQNKYYLFAPFKFSGLDQALFRKGMLVVDEDGYIAWYTDFHKSNFDFKYLPSDGEYVFTRRLANGPKVYHYEMNESFELLDSITTVNGVKGDIHEFQIFPNGNRCVLATKDSLMDLSGMLISGVPGSASTTVIACVIQEFDPAGNLVFEWNSLDHISPDHYSLDLVYNANSFDYVHANAIERDTDGNLIVSLRAASMACKIDHVTGDVIWKLGGNQSDFTFTNDTGFYGQHDVRRTAAGTISVYDNDYPNNVAARGVEYSLDMTAMTATRVYQSDYLFQFDARALGSYGVLDNGYRLLGWGNVNRPAPSITLHDSNDDIAAEFFMKDTMVSYRAYFQELPNFPVRPEIQCNPNGNDIELSLNGSHSSYLWSNGATTPTIIVSAPGVYQCWVNQGIGMLGSLPYEVSFTSTCALGIDEKTIDDQEVVGYFDLMGRQLKSEPTNQVYIVRYRNGQSEKRFK